MKKLICVVAVACLALSLCGCSLIDQLQEWKNSSGDQGNQQVTDADSTQTTGDTLIIDLEEDQPVLTAENSREIILFFANSEGKKLKKEMRNILKSESLAQSTIKQLIKGPTDDSLVSTIPKGTALRSIKIADGLCTVDFNSQLTANFTGGLEQEMLTVYSIVNTLTQFSSIQEVQILIDGETRQTMAGHVNINQPLQRNGDLIAD